MHDFRMKQDKGENIGVSLDTKSQGTAVSNTTRRLREAKPVFAPGKNPPRGQTGFCARRKPVAFINHTVCTVHTGNELFVSLSAINLSQDSFFIKSLHTSLIFELFPFLVLHTSVLYSFLVLSEKKD